MCLSVRAHALHALEKAFNDAEQLSDYKYPRMFFLFLAPFGQIAIIQAEFTTICRRYANVRGQSCTRGSLECTNSRICGRGEAKWPLQSLIQEEQSEV